MALVGFVDTTGAAWAQHAENAPEWQGFAGHAWTEHIDGAALIRCNVHPCADDTGLVITRTVFGPP